jgi:glycosyltransferase involved in cell wall biosynthesis
MRIAYICADPGVPVFGAKGCSVHVQEILRSFQDRGCAVELFAARRGGATPSCLAELPIHDIDIPVQGGPGREQARVRANDSLFATLTTHGPFDMVYERYALWSWRGMQFARDGGIPGVLEANAPLIDEQLRYRTLFHRDVAVRTTRRVMSLASVVACVSPPVAKYARHYGAGETAHVVPNGVDPSRFAARHHRQNRSPLTIGFVGSLRPWHAVSDLVGAFQILHATEPATRLLLVGDGPQREAIEHQLRALPERTQQAVSITGLVPPVVIPDLLHQMDVAVAPYRDAPDFYFSPLKLFEYMAAALPVVASATGQIPHVISNRANGLLYQPGNVDALAQCLRQLVEDAALRRQLGRAARQAIVERHTWQAVVDRTFALAGLSQRPATPTAQLLT